jgi:uncharacterized protein (DUF2141 family)
MSRARRFWVLGLALALTPAPRTFADAALGKLVVEVSGLRSDQGQLLLRLFTSEDGFPTDGSKALRQLKQPIAGRKVRFELSGLALGSYAVACVHDENGDGKLDKNLLGIPKEGVGASNDAKGRMGPPKWQDARFDFKQDGAAIKIHVAY